MLSWSSGPTLGGAEAGAVAALAGVRASVVSGGVLCVAGSAVLAALLGLRRAGAGCRPAAPRARSGAVAVVIRSAFRREECSTTSAGEGCSQTVTNGTRARTGTASQVGMMIHQYMYPTVTPVRPGTGGAPKPGQPAPGGSRRGR
jgi:hypothetical protein